MRQQPPSETSRSTATAGRAVRLVRRGAAVATDSLALALLCAPLLVLADLAIVPQWDDQPDLGGGGLALAFGLALAAAGVVGLLQAPLFAAARGLVGRPAAVTRLVAGAVVALPLLAGASAAVFRWSLRVDAEGLRLTVHATLLLGVAGACAALGLVAGAVAVAALTRSARLRRVAPFLGGGVAVLGLVWSLGLWRDFALSLRMAVLLAAAASFFLVEVALVLAGAVAERVRRAGAAVLARPWRRGLVWLLPALGFALAEGAANLAPNGPGALIARGGASGQLLALVRTALDRDRDGSAAWLGGADCDEGDPGRHRYATDVPGNGIDENCDGVDRPARPVAGATTWVRPPADPTRRLNVLFVCIEALRSDHVGFGGYERPTSPHLDAFAAKSWAFLQAVAASSATRESLPAVFSGRYPSEIAWERTGMIFPLAAEQQLLPDHLAALGYQTTAILAQWMPDNLPSFGRSFQRAEVPFGTETFTRFGPESTPLSVVAAVNALAARDRERPFFLFVHLDGPHHPYDRHDGVPEFGPDPVDRYDHEIRYTDAAFGLLVDYLEGERLLDDTIVAVFGDHGEEFQEHGGSYHAWTVHAESLHVPLVLHVPGERPARVATRVSLIDLFPTVLDVLGARPAGAHPQGVSLLVHVTPGVTPPRRPIFAELLVTANGPIAWRRAVYDGDDKLIWDVVTGTPSLYDLRSDPGERSPRADPAREAELMELIRVFPTVTAEP